VSTREAIHARLLAVLEAVGAAQGAALVERNRVHDLPAAARPALVLVDGDEDAPDPDAPAGGRRGPAVATVTMRPAVLGFVDGDPGSVGPALNALLAAVQAAVAADAQLRQLTGPNGAIAYAGADVDFAPGPRSEGGFIATFALSYVFDPANP
jgi:hypothetical protein